MHEGHRLGSSGRARRERDRGHTGGDGGASASSDRRAPGAVPVREHDGHVGGARRVAGSRSPPAVLVDHVLELAGRDAVERHVDTAREPHAEQRARCRARSAASLPTAWPGCRLRARGVSASAARSSAHGDSVGGVDRDGRGVTLAVEDVGEAHRPLRVPAPPTADRASPRGMRPSDWSGWPHIDTSSCARRGTRQAGRARTHPTTPSWRIAAGEFLAIFSASTCASSRNRSGGSTICEIMPSS